MKETVPDFEVPSTRSLREPILECSELSAFILSLACPPQVLSEWFEVVLELHKTEVRAAQPRCRADQQLPGRDKGARKMKRTWIIKPNFNDSDA